MRKEASPRHARPRPSDRRVDWQQLLADAVSQPGMISAAYSAFWNYSASNMLLAYVQCLVRKLQPSPIHTFRGWLKIGRHVRKGEKALTLVMPVTVRRSRRDLPVDAAEMAAESNDSTVAALTLFVERPYWFVLSQTDGEPYTPVAIPDWDEARALDRLDIKREAFVSLDGNCQGYAHGRCVAVSPVAFLPHRTLLHEIAHVALGHTTEGACSDTDVPTPRDIREVEAESVALVCCSSLGLGGETYSRGYIQHWLNTDAIPTRSIHRIFKAADSILKAGLPDTKPQPTEATETPE